MDYMEQSVTDMEKKQLQGHKGIKFKKENMKKYSKPIND